jgi:hypothetical protein
MMINPAMAFFICLISINVAATEDFEDMDVVIDSLSQNLRDELTQEGIRKIECAYFAPGYRIEHKVTYSARKNAVKSSFVGTNSVANIPDVCVNFTNGNFDVEYHYQKTGSISEEDVKHSGEMNMRQIIHFTSMSLW